MCGFGLRIIMLLVIVLAAIVIWKRLTGKGGMKMGIVEKFFKKKVEQTGQDFKTLLMKADFDTMTEAQISVMEDALDNASTQLAEAKREADREVTEAEQIEKAYQKKLKAAELLGSKVNIEEDAAKKASLEESLSTLLSELEEMVPEVEQEKLEAEDAKQNVADLTELVNTAASNLKGARKRLTNMQRELQRAETAKEKADKRADNAAAVAGVKKQTDSMSGIFDTLQGEIDKTKTQAESARIKAEKLKVTTTTDDPNIAAALAEASGETDKSELSLSDRLAKLKK